MRFYAAPNYDSYIVTGNIRNFPISGSIIAQNEMIAIIVAENGS